MKSKIRLTINEYFNIVSKLQNHHIINSKNYLNDIYSYIATEIFKYKDVLIYSNNCPKSHPCIIKNLPINRFVLVVLGPLSNLKMTRNEKNIEFYYINSNDIRDYLMRSGSKKALQSDFFKERFPSEIYRIE